MSGRSIRARLIRTLAVTTAAAILVAAVAGYLLASHALHERDRRDLQAVAVRVVGSLVAADGATVSEGGLGEGALTGLGVLLLDEDGAVLSAEHLPAGSAAAAERVDRTSPVDVPGGIAVAVPTGDLGLSFASDGTSTPVDRVVLVSDGGRRAGILAGVVTALAVGAVLLFGLLLALAVAIVGRGLRPLTDMTERAARIADGDRTVRLPVDESGDPAIAEVARVVNAAFDAQQDAEQRQRAFVADASHELRSPLTAATGWVELYLSGGLDDQGRRDDAMERVETQLVRMRLLVEELSQLARTDAGRPMGQQAVDLAGLAAEVVADARVVSPGRELRLADPGPAIVRGDQARLAQVLRNLVGNAVQHTPDGTVVTVTVVPGDRRHRVLVADTGPGIPADQLPHLFERFWRGDPGRSRASGSGGSGLGLAIAQSLVEAHGGRISVRSAPGAGTAFTVDLPAG